MKKLILLAIFCINGMIALSQDTTYRKLQDARTNVPLYLVNSNIIGGLGDLNPNLIQSVNVYKTERVPDNLKNLGLYGIVVIETKQTFKTKTFKEIKDWLNIEGKVIIAVDGFFVDDETLTIDTNGIIEVDVIRSQNIDKPTTINLWTLASEKRHAPLMVNNANSINPLFLPPIKPGTVIVIR
jgi:hypothetical protein